MTPTVGRILHYRLGEQDVFAINRRRTDVKSIAKRKRAGVATIEGPPVMAWPQGAQAHIGNRHYVGQVLPLIVCAVRPNEYGENVDGVNGQVLLDGNDVLWVRSIKEGTEPGTWSWPPRA